MLSLVEQVTILCQHILCGLIGTIGNLLVLIVYKQKLKENETTAFFIVHLAISDFFCCFILLPINCYVEMNHQQFDSDFLCKFHQFLNIINITYSCFLMTLIAFERYFSIVWPLHKILTKPRSKVAIFILLVLCFGLALFSSLAYGLDHTAFRINSTNLVNMTEYSFENRVLVRTNYCSVNNLLVDWDLIPYLRLIQNVIPVASFFIILVLYGFVFASVCRRRELKRQRVRKYRSIVNRSRGVSLMTNNNTSTSFMLNFNFGLLGASNRPTFLDLPTQCSNFSINSLNQLQSSNNKGNQLAKPESFEMILPRSSNRYI
jgi:hypothetical protein